MIKIIIILSFFLFLFSCSTPKKSEVANDLPSCLVAKIKTMAENPNEGSAQSITRYSYHNQKVYYMKAPCCDKYNIVFDSVCNILGYPDGGFTGKGDGKMTDFFKEAKDGKVVWNLNPPK